MAGSLVLRAARSQMQRRIAVRSYSWFGRDEEYTTNRKTNGSNAKTNDFGKPIIDEATMKSEGFWAKVIENKNQLSTNAVACFWWVSLYPHKKYIDQKFEALSSKSSNALTVHVISLSKDEVKYWVPMPGMKKLDECSYMWDNEGLLLTIRGDDGEFEYSYTREVLRRFRYGNVTFDSLTMGMLTVSVKVRGYHNPHTQTQPHTPNEHT